MNIRPGKTYSISQLFHPQEASKLRRLPKDAEIDYYGVTLVKTGLNKVTYEDGRKTKNDQ